MELWRDWLLELASTDLGSILAACGSLGEWDNLPKGWHPWLKEKDTRKRDDLKKDLLNGRYLMMFYSLSFGFLPAELGVARLLTVFLQRHKNVGWS